MKKLFLLGLSAIALLLAASAWLIWRSDPAAPPLAIRPAAPAPAEGGVAAPAQEAIAPAPLPAPELASDRDPRNDVQRPSDRRGDLLQEERLARQEDAMAQLNRRSARRRETMKSLGEVRPSAPAPSAAR